MSVSYQALGDGVGLITLARPDARNALTLEMVRALGAILDRDLDCRVLVLAGEGPVFCAGLDLKEAMATPRDAVAWMALQELFAGIVVKLRSVPMPVVAAVQGAAVGAGFGLCLAADVRIAGASATFLVGAVRIGLSAGECGISYHLPRIVGAGRGFEIMLTGRAVGSEEASAIGLVSRVVADADLRDEAIAVARTIAANSPYSIKQTKQVMWQNLDAPSLDAAIALENHVQVVGLLTEDFREGATAFAEKRAPRFQGR